MSQSTEGNSKDALKSYLRSWNGLAEFIRQGQSFSGRERNCVFFNTGDARWADVSAAIGLDFIDDGRTVATSDWDHDGDLDFWIANRTGPRVRFVQNNMPTNNEWLQLRLVGRDKNRDAIGARVEVHFQGIPNALVKTVRAGSSFVSQSSKWLHFGLGLRRIVDRVVISWPDGFREELLNIQHNRRYTVHRTESNAVLDIAPPDSRTTALKDASQEKHAPEDETVPKTGAARIVLTRRRKLQDPIFNAAQEGQSRVNLVGKATLITLWTSSCNQCVSELTEFADHAAKFHDAGITVLALCADDFTDQSSKGDALTTSGQDVAVELSTKLRLEDAPLKTVKALSVMHGAALYQQQLPLPASFLVDEFGRVAVIYRGRVAAQQVLADAELVRKPTTEYGKAFPFPGRDGIRLFPRTAINFAAAYEEAGYYDEAEQELVRYIVKTRRAISARTLKPTATTMRQIEQTYFQLATMLQRQGRTKESVAVLKQALKAFPGSERLRTQLKKSTTP